MQAITVIESDDGAVIVAGVENDGESVRDVVRLLHRGIEAIATPTRWVYEGSQRGTNS